MFRWWLPAGFVTEEELAREIRETAEKGFRGLEICINMADTRYSKAERAEKGWGTPHWRDTYKFILKTANRYGLQIDMTISPGWPAGIPGIGPEDDCAAKELNAYTSAPFTGCYQGPLPDAIDTALVNPNKDAMPQSPDDMAGEPAAPVRNRPVLQAVTAARIIGTREVPMSGGRFGPPTADPNGPKTTQYLLDFQSMRTVSVNNDDTVNFTCPDGGAWLLFAFYMQGSAQTNRQGSATELPCYAVDHLNRRGAEAVISYWEQNILDDELRALLRGNNGVIFEDSIELDISDYAIHWSPDQLLQFRQCRGYDMTPYLPLLVGLTYMDPKPYKYEIAGQNGEISDLGNRFRNDYCQFLTEIYAQAHIQVIQRWAASLGMGYRSQGYGLPFDLTAIAAVSHGPEGESLGFGDGVRGDDRFRTISGGAHMAGRPIISDEMGAVAGEGYRWTWKSMLKWINKNLAGGSNLIIFHGMPYAKSNICKWPGYSPFGFGLAGQWGPRQPEWEYIGALSRYLSRTQAVLQSGRPQVDLAILKVYYEGFNFSGLMPDQTLMQHGYTYDFVSPNTLMLNTNVSGGRFAPDGPAYQAIILDHESALMPETTEQLLRLVGFGVKLVICGDPPDHTPFLTEDLETDDALVQQRMQELLRMDNVRQVRDQKAIVGALEELGILPSFRSERPADLMCACRRTEDAQFAFVLYRGDTGLGELSFSGTGSVVELDPWSGAVRDIPSRVHNGRTVFSAALTAMETRIFALVRHRKRERALEASGKKLLLDAHWSLSVERWQQDMESADITETKKTMIHLGEVPLVPWTELPEIGPEVSGIGTYTNTFFAQTDYPGAIIRFSDVRCQSVHVSINGTEVPVNHHTMEARAGSLIRAGENTIAVTLITTLGNQLLADDAFPSMPWMPVNEAPREFGLCGPVEIQALRDSAM